MAKRADLLINAGSYEPRYWEVTDPATGQPANLTVGYTVTGWVNTLATGRGTQLLALPDTVWRRTTDGLIYFEPASAITATWPALTGFYQAELGHTSGKTLRFGEGRFTVTPRFGGGA